MAQKFSTCNCPTLTSPNGGETISSSSVEIEWHNPIPNSTDGIAVWHEIFFTDKYDDLKDNEWKQIAFVTADTSSFVWKIPFSIRSNTCRLAIRCRDADGTVSDLSVTADNFIIGSKKLSAPSVISPDIGSTHRLAMTIMFDHMGVVDTQSQRAYYHAFYSSKAKDIDWTPISQKIAVSSDPFIWDLRDIPPSNDYEMKFVFVDENDNSSDPVIVDNLTIYPLNYVLLDSTPPIGTITIQNNQEFTNKRDVILKLSAFDEATEVKSLVLRQVDASEVLENEEQDFSSLQTWRISGEDGLKFLEAKFKDAAGNTIDDTGSSTRFFRSFLSNNNDTISAFTLDGEDVWASFINGSFPLYKNGDIQLQLSSAATDLEPFDGSIFVAIKDGNKGILQKFQDEEISTIHSFTALDSVINVLEEFQDDLYMALENGEFYKFDKKTLTLIDTFDTQVKGMFADVTSLYLFFENSDDIKIYDGTNIVTASSLDGSQ
tara:strand:- start:5360 stop:6823 length:1464 start_codon:yes stop_codon:yes gene_type:complete